MNEITVGLGTQMLLYLFILCDNSRRYLEEGDLVPGGVLYHPLSDLVVDRGQDPNERLKQMRMSGILLDDPSVVLAMEKEGGNLFVPAKLNKEGQPTGNVVNRHQFELLRKTVEDLLVGMADTLAGGDIAALPLQKGNTTPCTYCDYKAVCSRDPESPVRELTAKGMKQVLADMEAQEVSDDE
jgi:ATP-dependent helicase/nuclease subunit B